MAKVTNQSARMLHMGGVMCPPGAEVEVPDAIMSRQAVKDMVEAGDIAVGADAPKAAASMQKKLEDDKAPDGKKS